MCSSNNKEWKWDHLSLFTIFWPYQMNRKQSMFQLSIFNLCSNLHFNFERQHPPTILKSLKLVTSTTRRYYISANSFMHYFVVYKVRWRWEITLILQIIMLFLHVHMRELAKNQNLKPTKKICNRIVEITISNWLQVRVLHHYFSAP